MRKVERSFRADEEAASQAELVLGAFGYFLIVGVLLGLAGIGGVSIKIPGGLQESGAVQQGFVGAVTECIFTAFADCSQHTETSFFANLSNVFAFAGAYLFFFLQLLTFTLPIPGWLNAIIVLPPAIVMLYVGLRFARGGG